MAQEKRLTKAEVIEDILTGLKKRVEEKHVTTEEMIVRLMDDMRPECGGAFHTAFLAGATVTLGYIKAIIDEMYAPDLLDMTQPSDN